MKNTVLKQLSSVQSTITSMVEVCMSTKKVSQLNDALSKAHKKTTAALASVAEHPHRRNLSQTKKSLTVIDNLLSGLQQGLESRELRVKEFRAACSNLQSNFVQKFGESLSSEIDKFKVEAGIVAEEDDSEIESVQLTDEQQRIRQAIIAAEVSDDEVSEDVEEDEHERETRIADQRDAERKHALDETAGDVERRLTRLRSMRKLLPERMTTPYSMLRLPVVPNFEGEAAKNPVLLEKLAIPYTEIPLYGAAGSGVPIGLTKVKMERYVIFEQQMILLISKSFVNNLLEHKTEQIEEENKDEFGEHRKARKQLAYRIEVAQKSVDKAILESKTIPSQEEEIKRLNAKMRGYKADIDAVFTSSYTEAEKKLVEELVELNGKVGAAERAIDKRIQLHRSGGEVKPNVPTDASEKDRAEILRQHSEDKLIPVNVRFERDKKKLQHELDALYARQKTLASKVNVVQKKYAKTADLKKKLEQIGIMERKLVKARAAETARERLVPDAEAELKRLNEESERNEDALKNKRKSAKRAGAPITPQDYARSVLSVINERSGSKYALVTPIAAPNPRNSRDILCFWLMPTSKLSALMKSTGGKAKVAQWDFPFESERHVKIDEQRSGWVHPSDDNTHGDFLEFKKNEKHRPAGWKSRYGKPIKRPE